MAELVAKGQVAWLNRQDAGPAAAAAAAAPPGVGQAAGPPLVAPAGAPALPHLTHAGRPDRHKRKARCLPAAALPSSAPRASTPLSPCDAS